MKAQHDVSDAKTATLASIIRDRVPGPIGRILVVGCGTGREAGVLAHLFGATATGIDLGTQFDFEDQGTAQVDLRVMDAQRLDFENASFDLVYSFHALEHIENPYRALAEMSRVLKPGGTFVIGTPSSTRIVAYVNTDVSVATRILWNVHDWRMRLTGRWQNESGAHVGFEERQLWGMCASAFGAQPAIVSDAYYARLYGPRVSRFMNHPLVRRRLHPCTYVVGQKRERDRTACPLFVVGLPRSGTKLLRDLLNRHYAIHIPHYETEFLTFWARHWTSYGDLSKPEQFHRFYRRSLALPLFQYLRRDGTLIDEALWRELCSDFTVQGVFEGLVRAITQMHRSAGIWGDKSPSYTTQLPEIKALFPNAKFVHIVRDVRDHCLSVNRAFGKNMERAAHLWCEDLKAVRRQAAAFPDDVLELRYEDLISSPADHLRRVCQFLDVPFCGDMLTLDKSFEDLSEETAGIHAIVSDNLGKFQSRIPDDKRRRIESLAAPMLRAYGYPLPAETPYAPMRTHRLFAQKLADGFSLLRNWRKNRMTGPASAFFFLWRYHMITGGKPGRARWGG